MIFYIHYRIPDGEIFGWENSQTPHEQPGLETVAFNIEFPPNPLIHKVDHATVMLTDKTDEEKRLALLPPPITSEEITAAIRGELAMSDAFMMPDRPISDTLRASWITYRQMLRDLSKLAPETILGAWGTDPTGRDAAAQMRGRRYAGY